MLAIRLAWPAASFDQPLAVDLLVAGAMAMAAAVVMIGGGIDLSGGAVMALAAGVAAATLHAGGAWWLALATGLGVGGGFGVASGALVAVGRLPPALATLGAFAVANGAGPRGAAGVVPPLPHPLVLLAVLAAGMTWAVSMTVWGRHLIAAGDNAPAARAQGVKVVRLTIATYVLSALLASLAGVALLSVPGATTPGVGVSLQAIAAATIGGASLSGGQGSIAGALLGAALLVAIRHVLLLAGLDADLLSVVVGACLVLAAARLRRAW